MISNLRISVAELIVWALLATAGLTWISLRVLDGAAWLMDWLRDRVTPLLEDEPESGCDCCELDEYDGPLSIDRGGTCGKCGHPDLWHVPADLEDAPPLPPERTWEQMTSHQLPVEAGAAGHFLRPPGYLSAPLERRPPWWETEQRQAYAALDLEYPSGLLARVREAAQ